ncbi:MAG TPA: ATP-dependent zinc metalloprotease FtsH [Candidatus Angelobacter sp.]|nr:ATP-dependent zinc metalloprotease FtsH [Candidatus Angelobacter sp.]
MAIVLLLNIILFTAIFPADTSNSVTIPYTTFKQQITNDNVSKISATGDEIQGTAKKAVSAPGSSTSSTNFTTTRPTFADTGLETLLEQHNVIISATPLNTPRSALLTILLSFGPTILLIGGFIWLMRRSAQAAGGGLFGLGRTQARLFDAERPTTTFADVAGIEEAKQELEEVVDFLRDPQRYQRLGGTIPKGVLLIGPPGTGKTLLARAVAGEAHVPFLSVSASEFIEMIVGVGAARVRDLFQKARSMAPAIIFIDELDAIGRRRGGPGNIGGHDEQEQTLNQILTEMDGFDSREGVIVIAATNRADVLDQALLRPGRFDRRVVVQPPDRNGRAAILRIHTRNVPLGPDVDLDALASQTPGLVGADLRNLVNEAALLAARRNRSAVTMEDFTDALEKVVLGAERHLTLSEKDRERVAYHESGHALLGLLVPGADPVRKVSIVPRGMALGVTLQSPVDDRMNYPEDYLRARITGALGGRAAEEIVYGVVTTGAENDLQQITAIARQMVVRWGMSPALGPISLTEPDGDGLVAQRPYSEHTAEVIDSEVRRIVDECLQEACSLLNQHRARLDALTQALLREESLDEAEVLRVTGMVRDADGTVHVDGAPPVARGKAPSDAPGDERTGESRPAAAAVTSER